MTTTLAARFTEMGQMLAAKPHLLRLGALFSETVLIEVDGNEYYLTFHRGQLERVTEGPSRQTPWRFALRVDGEALAKFWEPVPEPCFHDIFGFVKTGRGRIDGDILALVKNLRFFKEFMALGRSQEVSA
ncbi:hypothetical protein PSM7751_00951 [Pseudooceanicola marinus]|uniref:SCP-2 sterol transfer family protein n=1 Tax=Pseudooceanicola marinus TaxID=396013 RepID=A0A1X6YNW1_9RHOB|nr:hypothetical protein [Pseudooceanicola marinus]MBY5970916.1 hypothetical protein [Ferrimonas balearica]PJE29434.1 hypothetical protein CVM50_13080 [Pseudooceanicola marinus]SLN26168.1 hypothetical protein PSM7751_00951 [Pseudooceanicola marinus]